MFSVNLKRCGRERVKAFTVLRTWRLESKAKNTTNCTRNKSTEMTLKVRFMFFWHSKCVGVEDLMGKVSAIARTIALEKRVMVNPEVSLLDLTVEAGIPGDVMRAHVCGKDIVSVTCHDRFLVDMVNESLEDGSNITCDEDSNKHVTRIWIQHVMRIRIQHVTRISIQHVTRIQIYHVTRIQI